MKRIDAVVDSAERTEQMIIDFADARNRNLLAFKELQHYNDTSSWLNKHPLIEKFGLKQQYQDLLKKDTTKFLTAYSKTTGYVSRYSSYLNNSNRSEEQHEKDQKNLNKHRENESLMREVLEENKK